MVFLFMRIAVIIGDGLLPNLLLYHREAHIAFELLVFRKNMVGVILDDIVKGVSFNGLTIYPPDEMNQLLSTERRVLLL